MKNILPTIDYNKIPSPCFVLDERRLRANLSLIKKVKEEAGVEIIMAFKAFAMFPVFPIIKEYISKTTASSLSEAMLAKNEMGSLAHTYAPIYTENEFDAILDCSSHVTFNSLSIYNRYQDKIQSYKAHHISCGLRVNPEYSEVETDLYNPCAPGSRLGVTADLLGDKLPEGIEGLHFHTLCESSSFDLEKTLSAVETKFSHLFSQIKWINFGGGHLMTRSDYDVNHLVALLKSFRSRYPHLEVILEPGAAFVWQTGELVATIEDIVENHGVKTAMLNVSFACHMPDCLEMPYKPMILGAKDVTDGEFVYRMGGNSCLSGDYCGEWEFDHSLKVGERIVFLDMIHYTMVKTTMFNGVSHPSFGLWTLDNQFKLLKTFSYEDYKSRMG
ncbi:MAG: carboxynorspermidine decarboxylase [Paludibacteraceae bacterium]|nr:carboxynorspermidine decarboxylase [Paludibacteraceae bacterium]